MERGLPQHEELRQLLRERRFKSGLTQRQLAAKLRWDQRTISKIESGSKRVSVVELIALAAALGFDPAAAVRRVAKKTT
jgi:transcriptional regulator with XRE-family HTH domain